MTQKSVFSELLTQRKPILAYNPPGLMDPSLAVAVSDAGGIGLIDCERLSVAKCQQLLNNSQQAIPSIWGVRVTNDEQLALVLNLSGESVPKIIIIATNFTLTKELVEEIISREIVLLAEVTSLKEAYSKRWADSYLVKGYEAAGSIGEETSYILVQQFANAGLSFMIQGGIGFYSAPAVFSIGAQAVVLDTQLYLTPESPLSTEVKEFLSKLDATDTEVLGNTIAKRYRVYARLGTKIVREFLEKEKQLLANSSKEERIFQFNQKLLAHEKMFASKNIANSLIPVGQDIPFAKILTDNFSTVERIINALLSQTKQQFTSVQKESPFQEYGLENLDIKYPIIQGPMANVSENPAFAEAISSEGGLPFLALGSLFPNQTRTLIEKTKKKLGSRPFGVGLIGLEANSTAFASHLKIIKKLQPPYAVVAAGTIVQAKEVKSYGIKTFLHTPSPLLFREAIESDLSHLVLEGMECGGHIGVLTSFVLWELAFHQLKQLQPELNAAGRKITVAFAGGICDRFSAAMVGVFINHLSDIMEGVMWIGSAYILTKEIVDTEAIKSLYQQLALNADKTMVLGETVNTRARSIPTPFAKEILKRELDRLKKGMSLKERKHKFERDNLGATRIAALGEIWNPDGEDDKPNRFMPVDEEGQYQKGNYLIGQVVANIRSIRTIHDLHKELIYDSVKVLKNQSSSFLQRLDEIEQFLSSYQVQKSEKISQEAQHVDFKISPDEFVGEGVAIVGLGGVFPDALDIPTFWQNILDGVNSIREVPAERWANDINLFYHPDPSILDKSYTKIAATITDLKFDPIEFKIPPKLAQSIDPVQKMALMAAKEALEDANL
ncbi:MAG: hypothetical protein GF308_14170, partial [Candidatus Heimdallarchaeota archaeon]|nr:hypothetical protein [Candidatus Heimdallarchaeota archaeon]